MTEMPTRQALKMRLVGTVRRDAPDWTKRDAKTYLSKDFIARRLVPCYPVYVRLGTVDIQNVFHLAKLFGMSKQQCNDLGLVGTLALECDHRIVCTQKERVTEGAGPDSVQATATAFSRGIAGQGRLPLMRAAPEENTPGAVGTTVTYGSARYDAGGGMYTEASTGGASSGAGPEPKSKASWKRHNKHAARSPTEVAANFAVRALKRLASELRLVAQFFQRLPVDYYESYVGRWKPPPPGEALAESFTFKPVPDLKPASRVGPSPQEANTTRSTQAAQGQQDTDNARAAVMKARVGFDGSGGVSTEAAILAKPDTVAANIKAKTLECYTALKFPDWFPGEGSAR